jgi:alkanesulfonate monooxygenase SsuD/methylene tetrahydromethanopterin reductase-like flavin-dependent oxidoreductase (luciferase family)
VRFYDFYRELADRKFGYEAGPDQFGLTSMVYVAKDEETAIRDARPHLQYFGERCFAIPPQMLMPPGYTSAASLKRFITARGSAGSRFDIDALLASKEVLVGTPDQVGERLLRNMERAGTGIFMGGFQVGDMPHDKVMRNLELFADKVMPYLPRQGTPGNGKTAAAPQSA